MDEHHDSIESFYASTIRMGLTAGFTPSPAVAAAGNGTPAAPSLADVTARLTSAVANRLKETSKEKELSHRWRQRTRSKGSSCEVSFVVSYCPFGLTGVS